MKVLITGAHGNLGQDLMQVFEQAGHEVLATDKADLDITNLVAVLDYVQNQKPDLIINSAAYNAVDNVEDDEYYPLAFSINAGGPRNLANAAKQENIPIIHFSTDYVFDGAKKEGYAEDDAMHPISKYGQTKAAGERFVRESGAKYYICRLSKIFGKPGKSEVSKKSFVQVMLDLAKEKEYLEVVDEEIGMPTYTADIAAAVLKLTRGDFEAGVYHLVNEGPGVTWFEFAKEIFEIAQVDIEIRPVPSYDRPADRPKFAELKNTKFPKLRSRKDALRDFLSS